MIRHSFVAPSLLAAGAAQARAPLETQQRPADGRQAAQEAVFEWFEYTGADPSGAGFKPTSTQYANPILAAQTERLRASLPRHRDLIRKIVEHGLRPV
jgi:alpha-N-arabinofuranosidase